MTNQTTFDQAVLHHKASKLDDAERLYRQVVSVDPNHFDALHMLGVIAGQGGRVQEAIDLLGRASRLRPESFECVSNLGVFLTRAGRIQEALPAYAKGASLAPQSFTAHFNYATALLTLKQYAQAETEFRKTIDIKPDHPESYSGLGWSLLAQNRLEESASAYRKCLQLAPTSAETANNLANVLRGLGRLDEANGLLRRAIWLKPIFPEAHNNLGHVLSAQGEIDQAILSFQTAVSYGPEYADGWYHLGIALFRRKRYAESALALRESARIRPAHALTQQALGNALHESGQLLESAVAYQAAVRLQPNSAECQNNLGNVLQELGRVDEAIEAYRAGLRAQPEIPEAHFNLGNALHSLGRFDDAIAAYQEALKLRPDYAEAMNNLGNSLRSRGLYAEAAGVYRKASELRPDFAGAYSNLGMSLQNHGELEEAADAFRRALELQPDFPEAHINLGNLLKDAGRLDEAIECYRRAQAIRPDPATAGNLLYALHFHPGYGPREIFEEHRKWNDQFIHPLASARRPHSNDRTPGRRLRIGYVSPDFREHPIGRFMLPLLANHDHQQFEIYCYSDVRRDTELTNNLKRFADVWRSTVGISDEKLAELIRADRIDVLVDLAMHMEGTRMLAFGRKPAPVQVTYLAYAGTTGSEAIDYRLTDPYLDPSEIDAQFYSEKSVRLRSYWCYVPAGDSPDVVETPALSSGRITFGCLNNFAKVSSPAIDAWCKLLTRAAGSHLTVHSHAGTHRRGILEQFASRGIDGSRIEFIGYLSMRDYLATYNRIDIALDPFPYPGGTTSCDAIWMGVPVVTLAGHTAVSRGGASILSNLELKELIAHDADQYVQIAAGLASDLPRLQTLRAGLRERMRRSPLMDAPGFARDVETAYRRMWDTWRGPDETNSSTPGGSSESAEELNAKGIALERRGLSEEAEKAYCQALAIRPQWPDATFNLANSLFGQGRLEEAVETYRMVIASAPRFPEPFNNMGIALGDLGKREEARAAFEQAVRINPNYSDAFANLSGSLRDLGKLDDAVAASQRALAINPKSPTALLHLGNIALSGGKVREAIEYFHRAKLNDATSAASHNLLFALNFDPSLTARAIAAEHAKWEREYVLPRVTRQTTHPNRRDPDRTLRIGYVSPDFRDHSVGRFLVPLFANHDRRQFEVFCYSSNHATDAITRRLRSHAHTWREILKYTDAHVADLIRADEIDILVDLSMHSGGSRIMIFAHKPAPVQVTYLAYAGTTGLHAIDYRLTDGYIDPPSTGSVQSQAADDSIFVEKPVRLRTYWCYQPPDNAPAVSPAPAIASGIVTFGCLNNSAKVNPSVLELWRQILQGVPNSRLLVHASEGGQRQRNVEFLSGGGISSSRIEFMSYVPADEYLRQYNRIDICLDPFPYAGGTTTCDAIYMGVPVITLPGQTPVSRAGASILSNAGLPNLIADSPTDYIQRANARAKRVSAFGNAIRNAPTGLQFHADEFRELHSGY